MDQGALWMECGAATLGRGHSFAANEWASAGAEGCVLLLYRSARLRFGGSRCRAVAQMGAACPLGGGYFCALRRAAACIAQTSAGAIRWPEAGVRQACHRRTS